MEIDTRTWKIQGSPDGGYVILEAAPVAIDEVLTLVPQSVVIQMAQGLEDLAQTLEDEALKKAEDE